MSNTKTINIVKLIRDSYPGSDLIPLDWDCSFEELYREVNNSGCGDTLLTFIIREIEAAGRDLSNGKFSRNDILMALDRARLDIEAVMGAFQDLTEDTEIKG